MSIEDGSINLYESDNTLKNAKRVFRRILSTNPRPTAIIAMSDIIAIGIVEAAHQEDVNIPEDISIVGFDDIPLAKLINPPLTTVNQPIRKKGRLSADLLSRRISGDTDFEHAILPTQLVIRESTKKQ